jgi:hypothetical protein
VAEAQAKSAQRQARLGELVRQREALEVEVALLSLDGSASLGGGADADPVADAGDGGGGGEDDDGLRYDLRRRLARRVGS